MACGGGQCPRACKPCKAGCHIPSAPSNHARYSPFPNPSAHRRDAEYTNQPLDTATLLANLKSEGLTITYERKQSLSRECQLFQICSILAFFQVFG